MGGPSYGGLRGRKGTGWDRVDTLPGFVDMVRRLSEARVDRLQSWLNEHLRTSWMLKYKLVVLLYVDRAEAALPQEGKP